MKQIIKITLSLLFIAASFTSCVDDKNFDTPQVSCDDTFTSSIPTNQIKSFQYVVEKYVDGFAGFGDEDADKNYFVGYVTSSDLKGNFYKEIFIQDKIENPSYALKMDVDIRGMYAKYPVGSKLYILLNGLGIDNNRGELTLAENSNEALGRIRVAVAKTHIFRNCTTETIVAKPISSATQITDDLLGKYVKLTDAQFEYAYFNSNHEGAPFADPNDSYDSYRNIVLCSDNTIVQMETSSFAQYSDTSLPYSKFEISGVLTRDYYNDNYVLKINSPNDIVLNDTGRCDPIYEENFESYSNYATTFGNWTNTNVNAGAKHFTIKTYSGNKYVEGSAFSSGENPLEMWLISEAFDLDNTTNEVLSFKTQAHHSNGVTLSVYTSTDYSGDITSATWTLVNATIGTASSTYGPWTSSGPIDLSSLTGSVYIGFKYEGGDGGITTGMNIDDIKITGN